VLLSSRVYGTVLDLKTNDANPSNIFGLLFFSSFTSFHSHSPTCRSCALLYVSNSLSLGFRLQSASFHVVTLWAAASTPSVSAHERLCFYLLRCIVGMRFLFFVLLCNIRMKTSALTKHNQGRTYQLPFTHFHELHESQRRMQFSRI
jgi:hypothetical protein